MDIQIKQIPEKSQVELTIIVTPEELEPYLDQATKSLSKNHPINGFRPGKATLNAALKVYGHERVINEALEKGIPRWFVQAIVEHDIDALGRPTTSITEADIDKGVSFTATVDVLPEVKLGDPRKITAESREMTVSDDDVTQELKVLAKSHSTYIDVARPAQLGDTVIADFQVLMNGQPLEGGASQNHPIQLGEGHFVPDFENKLQGISAGDEREITMKFPENFAQAALRGREAQARVKAHEVKQRIVPALTDDFATKLGKFTSLAHLKEELKKNMGEERRQAEADRLGGELTEKLADLSSFGALPASLIEREIDRRLDELAQMLAYQKKTIEEYLQQTKKTPTELRTELREPAIRTVKVSLALRQFAKEQGIEADEEEVKTRAEEIIQHYQGPDHDGHHHGGQGHTHGDVDPEEITEHVKANIRNQTAIKKLQELATIKKV